MTVILRMLVDGDTGSTSDWDDRWNHIKKFLERSGPFMHPDFEPSTEVIFAVRNLIQICHFFCPVAYLISLI